MIKPAPIGVYVHLPFCVGKCFYCDFYSLAGTRADSMARYVSALIHHAAAWQKNLCKTANTLTADTLTADTLAANTLTADALTADALTADALTADALTADALTADALTADALTADALTADTLTADTLTADILTANALTADTLYLGGGTPSLLPPGELFRLVRELSGIFALPPGAEITLEANPDSLGDGILNAARESGVNRLSVGAQCFDDKYLTFLGRPHSAGQTRAAIKKARRAGFDNLSLDLIFGLPGQGAEDLTRTVDEALSFNPEHLSCYLLKLEPGTPLYEKKDLLPLLDEDEETEQYRLICRRLAKEGYEHYEISNFARKGHESRHNLKYWRDAEYLGLGAGAHSLLQNRRFSYAKDIDAYISAAFSGRTFPDNAPPRSPADIAGDYIMTGLRTRAGISLEDKRLAGLPKGIKDCIRLARRLEHSKLAALEKGRLSLTERGFWVSNAVISGLFQAAGL